MAQLDFTAAEIQSTQKMIKSNVSWVSDDVHYPSTNAVNNKINNEINPLKTDYITAQGVRSVS